MWKCPECNEEITHLRYSVNTEGREYGTADLNGSRPTHNSNKVTDYDCSDSDGGEWSGDVAYECPECNAEINIDSLEWTEESDEEEEKVEIKKKIEEDEEVQHSIIHPSNQILSKDSVPKTSQSTIICKSCNRLLILSANINGEGSYGSEEFCECSKCGEINSSTEYKSLLNQGFFDKVK